MTDNTADAPRSAHQLVVGAFGLYRRYPLLFLVLAAGVIVPYEAIVLATTGTGAFGRSSLNISVGLVLALIEWVLIGPLVSALHVHAVGEVREGRAPRLAPIARRGLEVLPVVAAASIISGIGIFAGFLALIVPGIFLMLRWYVVAQAAAVEHEGWMPALLRSHELTQGHYGHILLLVIYTGLIVTVPTVLVGLGFEGDSTDAASFLVGLIVQIFALSFGALVAALLYFDLRARRGLVTESPLVTDPPLPDPVLTGADTPPTEHRLDPRRYSDLDRPKGWYVDPSFPDRMRYWGASYPPSWGWSTRTPRKVRRAWRDQVGDGSAGSAD